MRTTAEGGVTKTAEGGGTATVEGGGTATVEGGGTATVEERWAQFFRYGPYALLGLATLIGAAAADAVMTRREMYLAGGLVLASLVLQAWWTRAVPRLLAADSTAAAAGSGTRGGGPVCVPETDLGIHGRVLPEGTTAGYVYFTLRTTLALTLTWLNPLFSIYAFLGYFEAGRLLPPRAARAGLVVTAVIMAGSQSGGLPPASHTNWLLFGGLFILHTVLVTVMTHLDAKEAERLRERAETITALEKALAENAALHAQLVIQAREAGVADERHRLAAEIHDTIAQGLAGIITQLQVVASAADPDVAREHLDRAQALARQSLGEARRSVRNLSPAALEHDTLPVALRKTVAEWSERTGVTARFTVTGIEEPLHEEVAATLLRIAQEALTNAADHADAARAGVTLSYMGDEVTLDIRDDGLGFDPLAVPPRTRIGGFGLDGMRARAQRIAGTLAVESEAGQGTAISARVPLVRHD
ncbi:sensor histidine kinase [Streptomyces europaeiscabiei]|uniref:sensor histidine kinase n=1 Tax=Streptomyces europaeiscabiei TaxID=146819 RepID=UPI0029BE7714|nr:sensor histidine kinase [Streptomyces europaeiscabiei]MDX3669925.1 sensor histidine kinase [Streptomyces europaeiscabiei]MDX3845054.1 sensor histidine kinase [Streptomyces europaeiscabiei]MDX3861592.1 sensor histidine kinase [Streptomyces europaeiscabiei]MDX3874791.1 sensor histidine kinase [Streptomyces europaeiscabiei]